MINLDVPTSFRPVPVNRGTHMDMIMKMPILALLWAFLGPFEGLNMINARSTSWNGGQCT